MPGETEQVTPPPQRHKFVAEGLATGPEGAVKVQVLFSERPTNGDLAELRAGASAQYRVFYKAWPQNDPQSKVTER